MKHEHEWHYRGSVYSVLSCECPDISGAVELAFGTGLAPGDTLVTYGRPPAEIFPAADRDDCVIIRHDKDVSGPVGLERIDVEKLNEG